MKFRNIVAGGFILVGLVNASIAAAADYYNHLILGFNVSSTGTTGSTQSVEVDLGSVGSYVTASAGTTYTIGNLSTALSDVYGSDWSSRSDLWFGVIGATTALTTVGPNGQAQFTVWASSANYTGTEQAPAWQTVRKQSMGDANTAVSSVYSNYNTGSQLSSLTQTTDFGTTITGYNNTASTSWTGTGQMGSGLNSASAFALVQLGSAHAVQFEATTASDYRLDLYQLVPNGSVTKTDGTDLGYFTLANDGVLTFTATAIPEPSTYAAILGAAAMGFVMIRRRKEAIG